MRLIRSLLIFGVIHGCVSSIRAQGPAVASKGSDAVEQHIRHVETCLVPQVVVKGDGATCTPLLARMQEAHVPGVSIAVVHNGKLEWARGYGVMAEGGPPVTPDTIFQAGSISKPLAAMGTLRLVQDGKLSLDADVNTELKSWKLPPSDAAPGAKVTPS